MAEQNDDHESDMMPLPYKYSSPALSHLPEGRHASVNTLCARCKNACWIATEQDLYCHCRVLFEKVWTEARKTEIIVCDGALLVQEEE